MLWQYLLTDLQGQVITELRPSDAVSVGLPLGRIPSLTMPIPLFHPYADVVVSNDCLIKAYRTHPADNLKRLVFNGPIVAVEETGEQNTQSIGITAMGPMWRLTKRILPGTDTRTGWAMGTNASPINAATIGQSVLTTVNGVGYTGISGGTAGSVGAQSPAYAGGEVKFASDVLTELSAPINSFEIEMVPTEPTNVAQAFPRIAVMNLPAIVGGVSQKNAIFEYGAPRANVSSYSRTVGRDTMANRLVMPPPGGANSPDPYYVSSDSTSIAARGLFDDLMDDKGITDTTLRNALVAQHLAVRKDPRTIITVTPTLNARPSLYVDFGMGDYVRMRATVAGKLRFDAMFRIWGVTFVVDKNGNEAAELELQVP